MIAGTAFVDGHVQFKDLPNFDWFGSLVTTMGVDFDNVQGTWEFDPSANDYNPG